MDAAGYLQKLTVEDLSSSLWGHLVDRLTIAETYFFRDEGQVELLNRELFPQLIREARGRTLRVWSAGCSTGEELYTLAMLLDEQGVTDVDLLGTDVNPSVVETAREGRYRERSLRQLPARLLQKYLKPSGQERVVASGLKARVRFQVHNLAQDQGWPRSGLDLIVCRNVLIYFARAALPHILERFYRALRPGGLLMAGHGELLTVSTSFEVLSYAHSLVYRRPSEPAVRSSRRERTAVPISRVRPTAPAPLGPVSPPPLPKGALRSDDFCAQARVARLGGGVEQARELLRKALYLNTESPWAYLELSLLLVAEDPSRARKHRATALELLAKTPSAEASPEVRHALRELEESPL